MGKKLPNGYWTKENCHLEALKYESRRAFQDGCGSAYAIALKNKWMDDICLHMNSKIKPKGYWTFDSILKEANKYRTSSEFRKHCSSAYHIAQREGFLHEVTSHMRGYMGKSGFTFEECRNEAKKYRSKKAYREGFSRSYNYAYSKGWIEKICQHMPTTYRKWTDEDCKLEAKKYITRYQFQKKSGSAYNYALKAKILDKICAHMLNNHKPTSHWNNKENCQKEALKYSSRSDFSLKSGGAYTSARNNGWLNDICSHMTVKENGYFHCIYGIVNDRLNMAYIGLTRQVLEKRIEGHKRDRAVNSRLIINEIDTVVVELSDYEYTSNEVGEIEAHFVDVYRDKGYEILNNISQIGRLGTVKVKWTEEKCRQEAAKYESRKDFQKFSAGAYSAARRYDILQEICSHMISKRCSNGYWNNKERCSKEARKYKSIREFNLKSGSAYQSACRHGWIDEITTHMKLRKPKNYWSKETCATEALKYYSRTEFCRGAGTAYGKALKNNWLDEICTHMTPVKKPHGFYSKDYCIKVAMQYDSVEELRKNEGVVYHTANNRGWLNEICNHMS